MPSQETLILVGQVPPPFHGQAVATKVVFDHGWPGYKVIRIPMRYSRTNDEVGSAGLRKVGVLFRLIIDTVSAALKNPGAVLYYPPSGPNRTPLLRDIAYLWAVRPFVSGCVFHYHAGGLVTYLKRASAVLRFAARRAYSGSLVSIEISKNDDSPGLYFGTGERKIVRNGLPVPAPPSGSRSSADPITVLFVGSLRESKGILEIIETAALLKDKRAEIVFRIFGKWINADFEKQARDLIETLGVSGMVEFPGLVTGEEKWITYQAASLFFFPTHYESENFPLVLIEGMGSGLPVVTTHWRGIPELVGDSGAGILCGINSPAEYADAIRGIVSDPGTQADMSSRARSHYEANYTEERFLTSMEEAVDAAFGLVQTP